MRIGFTGSASGTTKEQRNELRAFLINYTGHVHHGDCVGSDEQFHNIVVRRFSHAYQIWLHPPENDRLRAFCKVTDGRMFLPRGYLERDRNIVLNTDVLLATPKEYDERFRGSGTWYTIRFARQIGRPVRIIFPDGSTKTHGRISGLV